MSQGPWITSAKPGIVLDIRGDRQLAAGLVALDHDGLQHGAGGIDRGRVTGRVPTRESVTRACLAVLMTTLLFEPEFTAALRSRPSKGVLPTALSVQILLRGCTPYKQGWPGTARARRQRNAQRVKRALQIG